MALSVKEAREKATQTVYSARSPLPLHRLSNPPLAPAESPLIPDGVSLVDVPFGPGTVPPPPGTPSLGSGSTVPKGGTVGLAVVAPGSPEPRGGTVGLAVVGPESPEPRGGTVGLAVVEKEAG